MEALNRGLLIEADAGPGILHRLTGVMAGHKGDIDSVSIIENTPERARVFFEVTTPDWDAMLEELRADVIKVLTAMYQPPPAPDKK